MKKKILIDVDQVICDDEFLPMINKFLNTNYKLDDFTEYYLDDVLGSDENKQEFYKLIRNKNLYEHAKIYDNCKEVMKRLNEKYDVYIYSACVMFCQVDESGIYFKYKYDFLIKEFPFLDPNKFIFTNTKNIMKADIQIDDRLSNLEGEIDQKLLFTSYHNKTITKEELDSKKVIRVNNWKDIENILL